MKPLHTVDFLKNHSTGQFRFINKARSGYMSCFDARESDNERFFSNFNWLFTSWKRNVIQSIEFKAPGSDYWLTVYAKKGKNVHLIDKRILNDLDFGTINYISAPGGNLYDYGHGQNTNPKASWATRPFQTTPSDSAIDAAVDTYAADGIN